MAEVSPVLMKVSRAGDNGYASATNYDLTLKQVQLLQVRLRRKAGEEWQLQMID
jgi:hypothetical protein